MPAKRWRRAVLPASIPQTAVPWPLTSISVSMTSDAALPRHGPRVHRPGNLARTQRDDFFTQVELVVMVVVERDEVWLAKSRIAFGKSTAGSVVADQVVVEVDVKPVPRRLVDQVGVGTVGSAEHVGVIHDPAVGVVKVFARLDCTAPVEVDGVDTRSKQPVRIGVEPVECVTVGVKKRRMKYVDSAVEIGDTHPPARDRVAQRVVGVPHLVGLDLGSADVERRQHHRPPLALHSHHFRSGDKLVDEVPQNTYGINRPRSRRLTFYIVEGHTRSFV